MNTATGKNIAEVGPLLNKPVGQLSPVDASKIVFAKIEEENMYRVNFINKLIDVADFQNSELEEIMEFLWESVFPLHVTALSSSPVVSPWVSGFPTPYLEILYVNC